MEGATPTKKQASTATIVSFVLVLFAFVAAFFTGWGAGTFILALAIYVKLFDR